MSCARPRKNRFASPASRSGRRSRSVSMPARRASTIGLATATTSARRRWSSRGGCSMAAATRARVREARAAERQVVLRQEEIAQQIQLEVQQAFDRLDDRARLARNCRCARRCRSRGIPHRQPQARRRRHQPGRVHRRAQRAHRRRAQSQRHSLRRARAPRRARICDVHGRHPAGSGSLIMRTANLLVTFACAVLVAGCNTKATRGAVQRRRCASPPPSTGPAAPSIRTNGLVANKDEIRLSFKVGGVIRKLSVSEGEDVRKGQRLAEIELTEVNAQVEQARQAPRKRSATSSAASVCTTTRSSASNSCRICARRQRWPKPAAELRRVQPGLRGDHRAARRRGAAQARRRARAGRRRNAGAGVRREDRGFVVRAGARRSRNRAGAASATPPRSAWTRCPTRRSPASSTEVASAADAASGMFRIEVRSTPTACPLMSGLVAKLTACPSSASAGSLYVPIGAIVEGDGDRARVRARKRPCTAPRRRGRVHRTPTASRSRAASRPASRSSPTARFPRRRRAGRDCAEPLAEVSLSAPQHAGAAP